MCFSFIYNILFGPRKKPQTTKNEPPKLNPKGRDEHLTWSSSYPLPTRSRPVSTGCSGETSNAVLVFNTLKQYLGLSPDPFFPLPCSLPPPSTGKCQSMQNPDPILTRIRAWPASPGAGEPTQTLYSKSSPSNPQCLSEGSGGREGALLRSVSVLPTACGCGVRSCQRCAAAEPK